MRTRQSEIAMCYLHPFLSPPPPFFFSTFSLPHQSHELNTANMNASKLEKVGIQLNQVANSPDMTASFLSDSPVTTEPHQIFSKTWNYPVRAAPAY